MPYSPAFWLRQYEGTNTNKKKSENDEVQKNRRKKYLLEGGEKERREVRVRDQHSQQQLYSRISLMSF